MSFFVPKPVFRLGQMGPAENSRAPTSQPVRRATSLDRKLAELEAALAGNDAPAVQRAILDLGAGRSPRKLDEAACGVLDILARPDLRTSRLAGHVLNFFVFEATSLSREAKDACASFLAAHGHEFTDPHSAQVVWELRSGAHANRLAR